MRTYSVKELSGLSEITRRTLQYYDNPGERNLMTEDEPYLLLIIEANEDAPSST